MKIVVFIYVEIDMEQKEQIEDKGFEDFKEQGNCFSITTEIEERADKYAKISQYILIMEAIEVCAGIIFPAEFLKAPIIYDVIGITVIVILITHIISLGYAICGYRMSKTKKTKETVLIHKIIPVVCLGIILFTILAMYLLWSLLVGFMPERISFFDWIF